MTRSEIQKYMSVKSEFVLRWYIRGFEEKSYRLQTVERWMLEAAKAELERRHT